MPLMGIKGQRVKPNRKFPSRALECQSNIVNPAHGLEPKLSPRKVQALTDSTKSFELKQQVPLTD